MTVRSNASASAPGCSLSPRPSVPSSRSSDRPIRNTGLDKVPQWGVQDKLLIHGVRYANHPTQDRGAVRQAQGVGQRAGKDSGRGAARREHRHEQENNIKSLSKLIVNQRFAEHIWGCTAFCGWGLPPQRKRKEESNDNAYHRCLRQVLVGVEFFFQSNEQKKKGRKQ